MELKQPITILVNKPPRVDHAASSIKRIMDGNPITRKIIMHRQLRRILVKCGNSEDTNN